jgi:hypothetical protein
MLSKLQKICTNRTNPAECPSRRDEHSSWHWTRPVAVEVRAENPTRIKMIQKELISNLFPGLRLLSVTANSPKKQLTRSKYRFTFRITIHKGMLQRAILHSPSAFSRIILS